MGYLKLKITPSSGNVFHDVGFRREEAEHLLVRADLMIQVQKLIDMLAQLGATVRLTVKGSPGGVNVF